MADSARRHKKLHLSVLTLVMLLKAIFWMALLPPLQIADEPSHFDDVQYRAEHGRAPAYDNHGLPIAPVMHPGASTEIRRLWYATIPKGYFHEQHKDTRLPDELRRLATTTSGRDTDGQATAMFYPGLYYSAAVPFYRAFSDSSVVTRIMAIRCLSLLFGLCAVICTYLAAGLVIDDELLCFAAALLVVLQPMESQMTVAVNNDAGVIGIAALLFYLSLRGLASLPGWPSVGTVVGTALCAVALYFTKPTSYGILPAAALAGAAILVAHLHERRVQLAVAAGTLVTLVGVIVFRHSLAGLFPGDASHPAARGYSDFWTFLESLDDTYVLYLVKSSWGQFGWLEYSMTTAWVTLLRGAFELVAVGTIVAFFSWTIRDRALPFWLHGGRFAFCIATSLIGIAFILFVEHRFRLTGVVGVIQGRNFLFMLPAFAIWTTVGITALVPQRLRGLSAALLVTGALLFHLAAISTIAQHHYAH
ncbi:MAG: hypothetical protein ABI321_05485 [Polyangia bacterium]